MGDVRQWCLQQGTPSGGAHLSHHECTLSKVNARLCKTIDAARGGIYFCWARGRVPRGTWSTALTGVQTSVSEGGGGKSWPNRI